MPAYMPSNTVRIVPDTDNGERRVRGTVANFRERRRQAIRKITRRRQRQPAERRPRQVTEAIATIDETGFDESCQQTINSRPAKSCCSAYIDQSSARRTVTADVREDCQSPAQGPATFTTGRRSTIRCRFHHAHFLPSYSGIQHQ